MHSDTLKATDDYSAAKATAPRVSLADMEGKIAATHYFVASAAIVALGQPLPGELVKDDAGDPDLTGARSTI